MDIAGAQLGAAVHVAVQKNVLEQVKAAGAGLIGLIESAPPAGSVNLPHQGRLLDVRV